MDLTERDLQILNYLSMRVLRGKDISELDMKNLLKNRLAKKVKGESYYKGKTAYFIEYQITPKGKNFLFNLFLKGALSERETKSGQILIDGKTGKVIDNPARHTWHVWDSREKELCKGSRAKCLSFYKRHGGTKAGLTFGYYA